MFVCNVNVCVYINKLSMCSHVHVCVCVCVWSTDLYENIPGSSEGSSEVSASHHIQSQSTIVGSSTQGPEVRVTHLCMCVCVCGKHQTG